MLLKNDGCTGINYKQWQGILQLSPSPFKLNIFLICSKQRTLKLFATIKIYQCYMLFTDLQREGGGFETLIETFGVHMFSDLHLG